MGGRVAWAGANRLGRGARMIKTYAFMRVITGLESGGFLKKVVAFLGIISQACRFAWGALGDWLGICP